jgi:hypothetical protein
MVAGPDAEVVGCPRVDVQLRRDAGALQRGVQDYTVFGITDKVGPAMRKKYRGRFSRDAQAGREFILVLVLEVARIGQDGEVRPAADLVDVVDRLVGSLGETRGRRDRQMARMVKKLERRLSG